MIMALPHELLYLCYCMFITVFFLTPIMGAGIVVGVTLFTVYASKFKL